MKPILGFGPSPLLSWRELAHTPALHVLLLLSSGILARYYGLLPVALILGLAVGALIFLAVQRYLPSSTGVGIAYLLWATGVFLLGGAVALVDTVNRTGPSPALETLLEADRKVVITGRVIDMAGDRDNVGSMVIEGRSRDVSDVDGGCLGRLRVNWYRNIGSVLPGDSVTVYGSLRRPKGVRNPNGFDYSEYLSRRNISAYVIVGRWDQLDVVGQVGSGWRRMSAAARYRLISEVRSNIDGPSAGMLIGMLLGQDEYLDLTLVRRLTDSGLRHILAVSGLHLGIIAGLLFLLLRLMGIGRRRRIWLVIGLCFLYLLLVGFRPSVLRAWIMLTAILLGFLLQREPRPVNSLAASAVVLLLVRPWYLFDVGFQLSYGATLFIIFFLSFRRLGAIRHLPRYRRIIEQFLIVPSLVSLAAFLGTAPILAWHFYRVYPISIPLNLIVIPLVGLAMGMGICALVLGWLPAIGPLIWWATSRILGLLIVLTGWVGEQPGLILVTGRPDPWTIILAAAAGLLIPISIWRPVYRAVLVALLVAWTALWFGVHRPGLKSPELSIIYLDVGEADAVLVRTPAGRNWLVDTGYDGERTVVPALWSLGIRSLDGMLLTHPHDDHIGGAGMVWYYLRPRSVVLSPIFGSPDTTVDPSYREESWHEATIFPARGDTIIEDGGLVARVVHTSLASPEDNRDMNDRFLNDSSIVIRLTYGDFSALLTGDLERSGERVLLESALPLKADVLKVGHHGSPTSTSGRFLETVSPRLAVISSSGFRRGRPSVEVLSRLRRIGCLVFGTYSDGAVVLRSDGKGWSVAGVMSGRRFEHSQENLDLRTPAR